MGVWAEQREKDHHYKETDTIQFNLPGFHVGGYEDDKEKEKEEIQENEIEEPKNEKTNNNSIRRNYQNDKKGKKKIELKDMINNE